MSARRISRRGLLGAAAAVPAVAGLNALTRGGLGGETALAESGASNGHAGHEFAHATFAPGRLSLIHI